jgi:hypothetical protein
MVFDPYEDLVVDFRALEENDANYSGMARAYRAYQLGRGEVTPLRERVKGNPQLAIRPTRCSCASNMASKSTSSRSSIRRPRTSRLSPCLNPLTT